MNKDAKIKAIKISLFLAFGFIILDFFYRLINNIDYFNREKCILYQSLPRFWFLFIEYFVELMILVFVGIFIAKLVENYFQRYGKVYPKNPFTAFLYASLLPVCACSVVPLIKTMRDKMDMKTIISFVVAAPILSPYTIILSFSILGFEYGVLRILGALILAISSGYLIEFFYNHKAFKSKKNEDLKLCNKKKCDFKKEDPYSGTLNIFLSVLPYLIASGVLSIALEYLYPKSELPLFSFTGTPIGLLGVILVGIPFYFCYGAEVFLLRPLIHVAGFSLGAAIAFSLTSTAICISSAFMLFKFLGKRLTLILILNIITVTWIFSYLVDILL